MRMWLASDTAGLGPDESVHRDMGWSRAMAFSGGDVELGVDVLEVGAHGGWLTFGYLATPLG